jgi:hypothetical protein
MFSSDDCQMKISQLCFERKKQKLNEAIFMQFKIHLVRIFLFLIKVVPENIQFKRV